MRVKLDAFDKLALGAWVALAAASRLPIAALETVKLCAFRAVTGIPCPGCGMGHALLFAFQGRWSDSFNEHPLGLPLLAIWTFWVAWGLVNGARGRRFSEGFPRLKPAAGAAAVALLLGVYAVRLGRAVDFDRRSSSSPAPRVAAQVPSAAGKPVLSPELRAAAAKWGVDAQIARLSSVPDGSPFKFAVIGDAEPGRFPWERVFAPPVDTYPTFVSEASASSAFILQLGDSVSKGTPGFYAEHFRQLDGIEGAAPLLPVIGNHDRSQPNGAANKDLFEATIGKLDYYFDHAGWRFVAVDTSDRRLRDDQLAWLKGVVPSNGKCVIYTHVPPKFLKGKFYSPKKKPLVEEPEPPLPKDEEYWRDVLTAYFAENADGFGALVAERRVARVYMGHIHAFGVARVGPTLFVLSAGGGSPLYPLPPGEPKRKMSHWLEVSVSGGAVTETVHERGGETYPMPLP